MNEPATSRRRLLATAAAALVGASACSTRPRATGQDVADLPGSELIGRRTVACHGPHQAGVATPPQSFVTLTALDLDNGVGRDDLLRLMSIWSHDIEALTAGRAGLADQEPELAAVPASLTVTVGVGPGFFDAAGLTHLRPSWLAPLPPIPPDRLQERFSGGDLVLQVCGDDRPAISHAVQRLLDGARTFATSRWQQNGFRHSPGATAPGATHRNLLGQLDGSRNLHPDDPHHSELVWAREPAWFAGGTSMVVRRIAMDRAGWQRADRATRENAVGRRLGDGAPLTGGGEHDEVDLAATDALGLPVIDAGAHVRRARTDDPTQRILRRPYSYDDPATAPGAGADAGLVFVSFQRDLLHQFVPLHQRLGEHDLLNLWTTPIGSAVFAVLPGFDKDRALAADLLNG